MAKARLAEEADSDLDGIFRYSIETFGLAQAERYKQALGACLARLAQDPRLGRPVEGRTRTFFQYRCQRHVIFYVKDGDGIFVVRVLHTAMDFVRHLPG